jgi:hypothetical protein
MGKQSHQKFADTWANQTNLGQPYGLSAVSMGKKLKELGLRGRMGCQLKMLYPGAIANQLRSRTERRFSGGTGRELRG